MEGKAIVLRSAWTKRGNYLSPPLLFTALLGRGLPSVCFAISPFARLQHEESLTIRTPGAFNLHVLPISPRRRKRRMVGGVKLGLASVVFVGAYLYAPAQPTTPGNAFLPDLRFATPAGSLHCAEPSGEVMVFVSMGKRYAANPRPQCEERIQRARCEFFASSSRAEGLGSR